MDWEQYQPNLDDSTRGSPSCQRPFASHLLTHAVSFALGSAATAYCLRQLRTGKFEDQPLHRSSSDASSYVNHEHSNCDEAEVSPKVNGEVPLSSGTPMRSVPNECSLCSNSATESGGEADHSRSTCAALSQSSAIGELEVALRDPTLAEILARTEYAGDRRATAPSQLLLQIALDTPARWTAADYEFVTHCKGLVSLMDHEGLHQHAAAMRIERLQNDIKEYIKLQLKRSEVGIQARDDRRKHAVACTSQLQVAPSSSLVHVHCHRFPGWTSRNVSVAPVLPLLRCAAHIAL